MAAPTPVTWLSAYGCSAPARSILLLESDHFVFPVLYLQEIERERRDVTVINIGWTKSSWYWRWLRRRDPSLPPVDPGARTFVERVARVLRAAPDRPVVAERLGLAALAGHCTGGWLAWAGANYTSRDADRDRARRAIDSLVAEGADRDPMDLRVLSYVALAMGDDDRLAGNPAGAVLDYLSSVPASWRAGLPRPALLSARADVAADVALAMPRRPHHVGRPLFLSEPAENLRAVEEVLRAIGGPSAAAFGRRAQP